MNNKGMKKQTKDTKSGWVSKDGRILKRLIDTNYDLMKSNFKIIDKNNTEIIELKKRIKKLEEEDKK